jgi:thymidylate synthase ThyX
VIIGNGMIAQQFAKGFANDQRTLIFASGVSDSSTTDQEYFTREEQLLEKSFKEHLQKTLIYFSTCSIFDPTLQDAAYILHKKKMERLISSRWPSYLICRTTNIVGNTGNPHTLINFMYHRICSGATVEIWKHAKRNILDVEDLYTLVSGLLVRMAGSSLSINIFNPSWYSMPQIIETIEKHLRTRAICQYIDKGSAFDIPDEHHIGLLFEKLGIAFPPDYFSELLKKYYPVTVSTLT